MQQWSSRKPRYTDSTGFQWLYSTDERELATPTPKLVTTLFLFKDTIDQNHEGLYALVRRNYNRVTLSPNSVTLGHARVTLVTKILRLYYNNDNFIYSYSTLIYMTQYIYMCVCTLILHDTIYMCMCVYIYYMKNGENSGCP